jgi:putative PEP-CTERM system TPR-repeat lipoprotein
VAALELADGNTSAASERYQAVLEQDEDHLPSLMQLASIAAAENREADMLARLEQAAEAHPQALPPRLTLARYYLQKSRPEQVAPLFTTLEKATRERPEVLHLLASAQLASRDTKAADNTLEDLLEASPESAQTHHMMALSALSQGDPEQAKGYWQKVLELDPQFLGAHLGLARIALATDDTAALERHLEILRTQAPDQPEVLMLRAAAASAAGEKGSALALASAAHSQVNSSKTLLAQAHYMRLAGDLPGALALRAGWLEQHPKDLAVRLSYADGLLAGGEEKPAIEHYETVLAASPNQVIALNNLAWLLRDAQPERSLELVRRAATLAPESAEVLDTLAVVEFEQERYRQAMRSIERALAIKPDNPSLRFHHAMILEASGEPGAAKDILTQLLTQEQAFPELAEAEALLQKLQ